MSNQEITQNLPATTETYRSEHAITSIFIDPVPAPRMTRSDKWKKRPCVTRYLGYKTELKLRANQLRLKLTGEVKVIFFIPMPQSWGKSKRETMNLQPHTQTPDVDNLLKGFMDAMSKKDSHVWNTKAEKRWGKVGEIRIVEE